MYDAIVVGARVAGAPTAMLLARKGYKVLLVDRDTFPSDIMSTHYIHLSGMASLKRWGLLDAVLEAGAPQIRTVTQDLGPIVLSGTPPPADGVEDASCPRRRVLDTILLRAAADAGAEVREGFSVQELTFDGDRVTGIRGHARGGDTVTEQAKVVVGADGVHSVVARAVKPEEYNTRPAMSCGYYSYWSGLPFRSNATIFNRGDRILFEFPTNDGLTCLAVECPSSAFKEFRSDIEGYFTRSLQTVPELAERVAATGRREEPFVGTTDLPNFFRKPYGPGWALVGDAGFHKDPVMGRGITDAFRDAELLADALDDGFAGRAPLEQALAGYQQQRDADSMGVYELTMQQVSWAPPPPETMALVQALAVNQEAANRFFGIIAGTTRFEEFMAPENIGRLIAQAQARHG